MISLSISPEGDGTRKVYKCWISLEKGSAILVFNKRQGFTLCFTKRYGNITISSCASDEFFFFSFNKL